MTTARLCACAAGMAVATSLLAIPAATTTAAATPWCAIDSLSLSADAPPAPDPDAQSQLTLIFTNVSTQSCTLQGYPDVDLVGPDDPTFGPTYRLPRQAGDPQPLPLAPGDTARAVLTFLPGPPTGWAPTTIVVTVPHTAPKTQLQTPWIPAGGTVLRQDAATHPGTYIGPVQAA